MMNGLDVYFTYYNTITKFHIIAKTIIIIYYEYNKIIIRAHNYKILIINYTELIYRHYFNVACNFLCTSSLPNELIIIIFAHAW